jgi:hypothetical protein
MSGFYRIAGMLFMLSSCALVHAAAPWALPEWKYRTPVQAFNRGDAPTDRALVALDDFPLGLLTNEGKANENGTDLSLLDEQGKPVQLHLQQQANDNGDMRLIFLPDAVPARGRRIFYLYYGNPKAAVATFADPTAVIAAQVQCSLGAEETAQPVPPVKGGALNRWMETHKLVLAETGKGQGFTPQPLSGDTALSAIGSKALAASGGAQDTVTFTYDVNKAGRYICWVRYLTALPGKPAQGTLALSLAYNNDAPVERIERCEGATAFRWVPLAVNAPFHGRLRLTAQAKSTFAALDAVVWTADPRYRPDCRDFQGRAWVRWRIDAPADYRYSAKVHNEINPYKPEFKLTGAVSPFGLQAEQDQLPFQKDDDYFRAGEYSPWVLLPTSRSAQWHSVLFFPPKPGGTLDEEMTVRLEFANRPSPDRIFHIVPAEPVEKRTATLAVRMPTTTTLEDLRQLESFTEWARRRAAIVEGLKLSPPPRLQRLQVGTWIHLNTRLGGGSVSRERAEADFKALAALGINMPSASGVDDELLGELFQKYGMIDSTWTAWTGMWRYTNEGYTGKYNYLEGETPPQRWQRVLDDFYGKRSAEAKKSSPNLFNSSPHINLGDEIGQETDAKQIAETPQLLSYFREWLRGKGFTPTDFGAAAWDEVMPLDDRKVIAGEEGTPKVRLYYWTWQFINDYTAMVYRIATTAVKKYCPQAKMIAANYQAGPMQFGYIGNNNALDNGMMDIFHLGRVGAFHGVMMEDWVHGWDAGIGRDCLGAEIMRAAARKHDLPLSSYLVGGEAIHAEFYAFLMHGIKENGLYLYGPITNIGPAWGEQEKALRELAEVTREVKKFEDAIADGVLRPRRAAMLVAYTSDKMQKKGLYFCPERQALYTALKHDYLQVDVVSEQEIVEDDILQNYDLLYLSDPQVREDVQRKIAGWVQGGGKLWASVGAANWDEYNRPSAILDEAFGVGKRDMVTQEDWLPASAASYAAASSKFGYRQVGTLKADSPLFGGEVEMPVWGAKLDCTPTTAQVIGAYEDGRPAVLLNNFGKGKALLVGALAGEAYMRQHYPDDRKNVGKDGWSFELGTPARRLAAALSGEIAQPVTLSLPGIYTSVMDSPQGTLVFLNNATLAAETDLTGALKPTVTVRVPVTGKVASIESAKLGKLKFTVKNGEATFTLPLPNADIILLRK